MSADADLTIPTSEAEAEVTAVTANSGSLWSNTEEDDCCRVCHGEAEESRPLFHPCKCSGSIKFVHQDCLQTWLKISNKLPKCELCNESFRFRNIYKAGDKLSMIEFTLALFMRVARATASNNEVNVVIILWVIGLPLSSYGCLLLMDMITINPVGIAMYDVENRDYVAWW